MVFSASRAPVVVTLFPKDAKSLIAYVELC